MTEDLDRRLLQCFRIVFPELPDGQLAAAVRSELPQWDSLASLNLVTVVEEEFGTRFDDDVVGDLDSFSAVRDAVQHATG